MELEPDTENVVYLDEYPHLSEKVARRHQFGVRPISAQILRFALEERQFDEIREIMETPPA